MHCKRRPRRLRLKVPLMARVVALLTRGYDLKLVKGLHNGVQDPLDNF